MQSMLQNIGGFQMPGQMPTQAPQVQTGGGDPYQVQNQALGPNTGLTPNGGMMQMNRIAAGSAPPAYGGGGTNWQDRPIGPMRTGPAPPMGSTAPPDWAATNPAMWNLLGGNAFSTGVNNGRGPWTWNRG
jgi:hypothetical protein